MAALGPMKAAVCLDPAAAVGSVDFVGFLLVAALGSDFAATQVSVAPVPFSVPISAPFAPNWKSDVQLVAE